MGYQGNVLVESQVRRVADTMQIITECVRLFVNADEEQRISFDDQIVPTAFEIIGMINTRASTLSTERREAFLAHIRDHGPNLCLELIARVQRRSPPIIHRPELVEKLITETQGY
jgi:hypothetical protein